MRKIQDLALIKSIEITDGLAAYNNENNTLRARLIFAYDSSTDNGDDDVLALLTTLTSTNQYSLIINLDNLPNINGMNDEQITEQAKQLLVGKKTTFTTYIFQIAELNETEKPTCTTRMVVFTHLFQIHIWAKWMMMKRQKTQSSLD